MADYITTYTGEHFYPLEPEIDKIKIEDIAHALSLLCRGNGHVSHFFSVGQHCINCALEAQARGYNKRICLACLVHDASEAYLSDVPRPFKKTLPSYEALEARFLSIIYQKFLGSDLSENEAWIVKQIDDDMLYFDLQVLLKEPQNQSAPEMKSDFSQDFIPFEEVEKRYLELYRKFCL
ncbi:MAG: hypothetical protein ACI4F4_01355 [Lachnospiraceae bacterium]